MLHYLHLEKTCFLWKDLPTIMGRTAEVVMIFPLSSMMFFWHSSVRRRVPVVPVELSLPLPIAIYIGSMSNPKIHFPLQDSPKQHKPFSSFHPTAGKSIIWNFMMDPLCILYQDMLMCSWLKNFFNWHQDFLIDFPTPTRFIWFSENLFKTPLVLPASYRIARFRLIYGRFVGKINEIWFYKRDCFMPCLSKEPPFFSAKSPDWKITVECELSVDCFISTNFCGAT